MPPCFLLRLNRDCLGAILSYCDFQDIISLRLTTRESFKQRVSECNLDVYFCNDIHMPGECGCPLEQLQSFLLDSSHSSSRGQVETLSVLLSDEGISTAMGSPDSVAKHLFLSSFSDFFSCAALRNLRVLEVDTGYAQLHFTGAYAALSSAARTNRLPHLTHCAVRINEPAPPDLRAVLCVGCPLIRSLEIREYVDHPAIRDDPNLLSLLLSQFFPDGCVWPSLQSLDIGWAFEQISDHADVEDGDIGRRIIERICRRSFPKVSTLQIRVSLSNVFLDIFRAIAAAQHQFIGDQILALDLNQRCYNLRESYGIQQDWNDFAAELSPRGAPLGARRMPVLFPKLQLIRSSNFLPSSYLFEFIPNSARISLQVAPHNGDPVMKHFLANCYRPGVLSPTIEELYYQLSHIYLPHERPPTWPTDEAAPEVFFGRSCFGAVAPGVEAPGLVDALQEGKLRDLRKLRVDFHVASAVSPHSDSPRPLLLDCSSLEHLVLEVGTPLVPASERRWKGCVNAVCGILAGLCRTWEEEKGEDGDALPNLHTLDILVHSLDAWSYIARHVISNVNEKNLTTFFEVHPLDGDSTSSRHSGVVFKGRRHGLNVSVVGPKSKIILST